MLPALVLRKYGRIRKQLSSSASALKRVGVWPEASASWAAKRTCRLMCLLWVPGELATRRGAPAPLISGGARPHMVCLLGQDECGKEGKRREGRRSSLPSALCLAGSLQHPCISVSLVAQVVLCFGKKPLITPRKKNLGNSSRLRVPSAENQPSGQLAEAEQVRALGGFCWRLRS